MYYRRPSASQYMWSVHELVNRNDRYRSIENIEKKMMKNEKCMFQLLQCDATAPMKRFIYNM